MQFVLCSGSLKDLARRYGVSYPTIRSRLNGVIARLRLVVQGRAPDPVLDLLARLVARGELSPSGATLLRDLIRQQAPRDDAQPTPSNHPHD